MTGQTATPQTHVVRAGDVQAATSGPVRGEAGRSEVAATKRQHGTLAAFVVDVCRCAPCKAASRRYENRRYRLQAYGQWQPYVDAEPVRAHVQKLRDAGLGWPRIARLAGVPRGSMSRLIYGDSGRGSAPSKRVRAATAAAILAIEPDLDVLGSTVPVDPTGTRRRIQALVALGWSFTNIADGVNVLPNNLGTTMRSPRVRAGTARAVRALYDQLWDQAPPENTHAEKLSASRARNRAKAAGWAPPMAWNDHEIDDPKARPRGVRTLEATA